MNVSLIPPTSTSSRSSGVKRPEEEPLCKKHLSLAVTFLLAREIQRRFAEALYIARPGFELSYSEEE